MPWFTLTLVRSKRIWNLFSWKKCYLIHKKCYSLFHLLVLAYSVKIYLDKWRVSIKAIETCVITEPRIKRAARSFRGQGRFWKIRAQKVINSSKRLNYMQTLQCASLQNEHFYQIKAICTDIYKPGNTMSWKKESGEDSTFSIAKQKMLYFSSYIVYWAFTF